jgi:hypothetical protein
MQTDWGGEYVNLNSFFQKIGITHHVSRPHAHQQNGSTKRKHRHIVEVGLALLANESMPLKFWDEAFLTTTFLINLLPSKVINGDSHAEVSFTQNPIMILLESLVVLVGQTFVLTTRENFPIILPNVCSLAIVLIIK